MKTIKTWLATIAVLLCSISASAYDFKVGSIYYNILSEEDKTVEVTYYVYGDQNANTYTGSLIIPNGVIYDGVIYSVTSIGSCAFFKCSGLTSITISNNVESIASAAFYKCTSLRSITIPNSVTSIGDNTFYGCSGLTSVTIPNSVTSIEAKAFSGCSGLTSVAIPNSVTSIGRSAFSGCTGLTSVTIPNSVTSIGYYAFEDCTGLTSVTIPNSVTSIESSAFEGCFGLTSIVVEEGNSVYDSRNNCNAIIETATNTLLLGIATTIIPKSVTIIGNSAFLDCTNLTDITIPNSVTSIGGSAFNGCTGLTSVTIPNSVTSIGIFAFGGCSGLTSVTISNSVTCIEHGVFSGCSGLTSVTIPNSVETIGGNAFFGCIGLTSITIPNSVKSIGDEAFYGCTGLTSVTIGNSVTSIGSLAFSQTVYISNVYCYAENVPSISSNTFVNSLIATLHVPAASLESYKTSWSSFFVNFVALPPNITLEDGVEYENNTEADMSQITYTRTLPNLQWNALFVPFEIPVSELADDYDVAYINDIHSYDKDLDGEIDQMEMEVIYIKEGTLHANHPYLIRAKNDKAKSMNIVVTDATLYSSAKADRTSITCSSAYTDFEVIGTYEKMTAQELDGCYAINTSGAWSPIASGASLNPFRLYMTITSRNGSPVKVSQSAMSRINIRVQGEDTETGIGEIVNEDAKAEIYDMTGRRLQNAHKGIYIINGKKVIK